MEIKNNGQVNASYRKVENILLVLMVSSNYEEFGEFVRFICLVPFIVIHEKQVEILSFVYSVEFAVSVNFNRRTTIPSLL